jgi:hypothetical protein
MFCPSCGLEERQLNQFCRACGTDMRPVRVALERPDSITSSAATAREEIGRAVAARIRETESAYELKKVAEDVLPEIEKFLESPEEKRMRRLRVGTIIGAVGLGVTIAFVLFGILVDRDSLFFAGLGLVTLFVGLGFIINAAMFTVPAKTLSDNSIDAEQQRQLDLKETPTNNLLMPEAASNSRVAFTSVTENTTHRLGEKQPAPRL